ncbi:major facilitator superfamily MFS-1 protein [Theileria orientalis]|uniref:Major facilitator superfamily MFS-1 protein n=1 Tax=Theileria orientalis TaxID=68886 RepID=A0A976M4X8_THEOR|nr:major facilitator superfamily MFS-1 protein [Theileria orientalis]
MDRTLSEDSHSSEKSCKETKLKRYQKPGLVFSYINTANLLQYVHIQFLTSSMLGLEKDMGFSPKRLSVFVLAEMMVIFRILNGIMVSSAVPVSQKYAVLANVTNAGYAFGVMHAVCNLGRLTCSIIVTAFSPKKYYGIYGWRICSFVLGILCLSSIPILFLIPKFKPKNYRSLRDRIDSSQDSKVKSAVTTIWKRFVAIVSVRTVIFLSLLEFFAQGTYTAATFLTIYLQYCKLSNLRAGITTAVVLIGSVTGGILGGIFGDYLHRKFPKYGRLSLGVFSCFLRFVLLTSLLFGITFDNMLQDYVLLVIGLFFAGTTFANISFVDRSVFLDVVMPSEQSFGISSLSTVCGATSSLIFPPLMGFLVKDIFGYQETTMMIEEMPFHMLRKNAFALRNGIAILCLLSTISTLIFYLACFPTYCKFIRLISSLDKDSKAVQERVEAEMNLTQVEIVKEPVYKRNLSQLDTN